MGIIFPFSQSEVTKFQVEGSVFPANQIILKILENRWFWAEHRHSSVRTQPVNNTRLSTGKTRTVKTFNYNHLRHSSVMTRREDEHSP